MGPYGINPVFEAGLKAGIEHRYFHSFTCSFGRVTALPKLSAERASDFYFPGTSNPNGQPLVMLQGGANKQARFGNDKPGKWEKSHEVRHHSSFCFIGVLLTIAPRLKAAGCEWKIAPKDRPQLPHPIPNRKVERVYRACVPGSFCLALKPIEIKVERAG